LGKVRDDEHLMVLCQHLQGMPDTGRDASTDTGVNFIEDQQWEPIGFGQNALEGQHDTGDFPSGGHPRQRPRFLARVSSDEKLNAINPCREGTAPLTLEFYPELFLWRGVLCLDAHNEAAVWNAQLSQELFDCVLELFRNADPLRMQPIGSTRQLSPSLFHFLQRPFAEKFSLLSPAEFLLPAAPLFERCLHRAVSFAQELKLGFPLTQLLQTLGFEIQVRCVALQETDQLFNADHPRMRLSRRWGNTFIDAGKLFEQVPDTQKAVTHGMVISVEQLVRLRSERIEPFGMFAEPELGLQRCFLARLGINRGDFLQPHAEPFLLFA
jgi:hypothetical protein